jgi:hypothetical protein
MSFMLSELYPNEQPPPFLTEPFHAALMAERHSRHPLFALPGDALPVSRSDSRREFVKDIAAAVLQIASEQGDDKKRWTERIATVLANTGFTSPRSRKSGGPDTAYRSGAILKWHSARKADSIMYWQALEHWRAEGMSAEDALMDLEEVCQNATALRNEAGGPSEVARGLQEAFAASAKMGKTTAHR